MNGTSGEPVELSEPSIDICDHRFDTLDPPQPHTVAGQTESNGSRTA
jgi:hypothetical protein